jgi:hypothetical protein
VCEEKLFSLFDDKHNPVRGSQYSTQARVNNIPLALRSLRYNCSKRFDAHLYVAEYTDSMSGTKKDLRVKYGKEHKDKPFFGFWDGIHFTDKAHFNTQKDLQKPRVLRMKGTRKNSGIFAQGRRLKRILALSTSLPLSISITKVLSIPTTMIRTCRQFPSLQKYQERASFKQKKSIQLRRRSGKQ